MCVCVCVCVCCDYEQEEAPFSLCSLPLPPLFSSSLDLSPPPLPLLLSKTPRYVSVSKNGKEDIVATVPKGHQLIPYAIIYKHIGSKV